MISVGTPWIELQANNVNVGDVDVASVPAATQAALDAIETATEASQTALELLDNAVGGNELQVDVVGALPAGTANIGQVDPRGNVAHDIADAGNPVKVGGRARTALPAAVAQDDRADAIFDKFGRRTVVVAPLDQIANGLLNRTTTDAADVIATPGSGVAIVVQTVQVINGHATVGTKVSIRDGTTAKITGYAGILGGGFNLHSEKGLFVATADTAVTAICGTTGADVDIFVSGYKIPA